MFDSSDNENPAQAILTLICNKTYNKYLEMNTYTVNWEQSIYILVLISNDLSKYVTLDYKMTIRTKIIYFVFGLHTIYAFCLQHITNE
jgi:hypothetical protein